jgi:hypothetical protein
MRMLKLQDTSLASVTLLFILAFSALLALPACSVNVKKDEEGQGKKVDIETPIGGIHVSKDAEVRDIGLPVYPGARPKEKGENGDENKAKVSLSSNFFGLRVAALGYTSDDPPEKIVAYYKEQLKKYGDVLECHTSHPHAGASAGTSEDDHSKEANKLTCDGDNSGKTIELKVGTKQNQHIVSVEPGKSGKGSDFGLVYVQLRGGKDTI